MGIGFKNFFRLLAALGGPKRMDNTLCCARERSSGAQLLFLLWKPKEGERKKEAGNGRAGGKAHKAF